MPILWVQLAQTRGLGLHTTPCTESSKVMWQDRVVHKGYGGKPTCPDCRGEGIRRFPQHTASCNENGCSSSCPEEGYDRCDCTWDVEIFDVQYGDMEKYLDTESRLDYIVLEEGA